MKQQEPRCKYVSRIAQMHPIPKQRSSHLSQKNCPRRPSLDVPMSWPPWKAKGGMWWLHRVVGLRGKFLSHFAGDCDFKYCDRDFRYVHCIFQMRIFFEPGSSNLLNILNLSWANISERKGWCFCWQLFNPTKTANWCNGVLLVSLQASGGVLRFELHLATTVGEPSFGRVPSDGGRSLILRCFSFDFLIGKCNFSVFIASEGSLMMDTHTHTMHKH